VTTKAEIHDVGYESYRGARTPPARRFWTIAKNVFALAWRSRWGVKLPFLAAAGTTVAGAVVMYVARNKLFETARQHGAPVPRAEQIIFYSLLGYKLAAYMLATVVACAAIADDLRLGAFQFYFSRPLRTRDYLAGKLLGLALVVGVPMFLGPVILAIVRVCLADDVGQAVTLLPFVPRAALLGVLGTAAFVLPPAALGALVGKRGTAQALYVVYFVVLGNPSEGLPRMLGAPALALADVGYDVEVVGRALFGVTGAWPDVGTWPAAGALAVVCAASLAAIWWRVAHAETAGLGG
jgi:hypothetical protein